MGHYMSKARHQMRILKLQFHFQGRVEYAPVFNCPIKKKSMKVLELQAKNKVLRVIPYLLYSRNTPCFLNEIRILYVQVYIKIAI